MQLLEMEEILHLRPRLGVLVDEVAALREQLVAYPSGVASASTLTTAEIRLIPYLPTHLTFAEIGQRLFVSRSTVKTQALSIYRKLGVSSRNEAVERARALSLLQD
jgi:LuxR family maltose regulon positive regulatory protein